MPVGEWNIRRTLEATVNENFELKEMAAQQGSQVEMLKAKLKALTESQQSLSPVMSHLSSEVQQSISPDTVQRIAQLPTRSISPTVRSPSELSAALHGLERSRAALQRQKAVEVEQLQQQLAKAKGEVIKVRQSVQQNASSRLVERVSGAVLSGDYVDEQSRGRLTEEPPNFTEETPCRLPKPSMSARSKFGQIARKPPQPPRAHRHTPEASATEVRPQAKTTDDTSQLTIDEIEAPTEEAPARSFISWWGRSLFE